MNKNTMIDCKTCQNGLLDLLTEEGSPAELARTRAHVAECAACATELREMEQTFALLDEWQAPEPSAFFDTRVKARLREAQQQAPAGLLERVASWWKFSSNHNMGTLRPAMAGALALVLLVGGGSMISFHNQIATPPAANGQPSATVNDLRILDNNEQALQQMDQLLDDNPSDDNQGQS